MKGRRNEVQLNKFHLYSEELFSLVSTTLRHSSKQLLQTSVKPMIKHVLFKKKDFGH